MTLFFIIDNNNNNNNNNNNKQEISENKCNKFKQKTISFRLLIKFLSSTVSICKCHAT